MSSYRVDHVPEHRLSHLHLVTATVLLAALVAVGIPSFSRVDITVDGESRTLANGATATDLIKRGWVAPSGDILDTEGVVVVQGRGASVRIMRGGARLRPQDRLADGDRIITLKGPDIVETEVTEDLPIPIRVEFQGKGPLMALVSPGSVGIERQVKGEYSGRVETTTVLLEAQPMVIKRFSPSNGSKVVALTFDDGPWPRYTEEVLAVLAKEQVKATFFMVGRQVYRYPTLVKRIRDEGHALGNHTQGHAYLSKATPEAVRAQIADGQTAIQKTAGVKAGWFRPPGGIMTPIVGREVSRYGLRVAMWTVDPQDWRRPPVTAIVQRVITSVKPGAVVLMHDGGGERANTVEALGPIIRELKKQGYTFVTLDELAH
ncbi:MAG: polysaccharide deacetylase family protein [Actinobacteria bacterium]|nr:polysaccharide deacetylase family protein [Actinomycetota bacterium]